MDASHSTQINELVQRFIAHQKALGLKDAMFAARFKDYVGSHKTWLKLKDNTWAGHVNEERILKNLTAFAEHLDGARSFTSEQFIPNLPYCREMDNMLELLLGSPLDIRGMISLAPQGVGKSWWLSNALSRSKDSPYFYLRLLHSYREKSYQIQCAIARKMNCDITRNPGDQMDELIRHCKALGQFVLFLDEAHNGGIVLFKILKDLIDETSGRFVYVGFPTEFDVIVGRTTSAIGESKQTLRRCLQPIHDDYRDGIMAEDVEVYLAAQGMKRNAELAAVATEIQPLISSRYNLTTLATAIRDAQREATDTGVPLTLGMVTEAVKSLCSTAAERRATKLQERAQKGGGK